MAFGTLQDLFRKKAEAILPSGSLRARLAYGTMWSFAGAIIAQGLSVIALMATARVLGRAGFGRLGMVTSTVSMFVVFGGMGLASTAVKYGAEFRVRDTPRAGRILGLTEALSLVFGSISCVILFVTAPFLASSVLNSPGLVVEIRLACALLLVNVLAGTQMGMLSALEEFQALARIKLTGGLIFALSIVPMAWLYGLRGAIASITAGAAVSCVMHHIALRRKCRLEGLTVDYRGLRTELAVLWGFSFPALLASAMAAPVSWMGNTMLVNGPRGYDEMGVFNAAYQWHLALMFLPAVVSNVNMPILSSLHGNGDIDRCKKVMIASMKGSVAAVLPVACLLAVFADKIMAFYGPGFVGQGQVLRVMTATGVLLWVMVPVGQVIIATGRMWLGMFMNLGCALILLVSARILLQKGLGAFGLALGYFTAYSVHAVWAFGFARRFVTAAQSGTGGE